MNGFMTGIICFILAIGAFIISFFSFREKGFLFNNVYLYASKEERATMDKKPHYRQSAIVFLLIGMYCPINPLKRTVAKGATCTEIGYKNFPFRNCVSMENGFINIHCKQQAYIFNQVYK